MKRFRFSLRGMLIVVGLAAVVLGFLPATYNWIKWQSIEPELRQYLEQLNLNEVNHIYKFTGFDTHVMLTVSTSYPVEFIDNDPLKGTRIYDGEPPKKPGDIMFVLLPGQWVGSVDEAVQVLKEEFYENHGWQWW